MGIAHSFNYNHLRFLTLAMNVNMFYDAKWTMLSIFLLAGFLGVHNELSQCMCFVSSLDFIIQCYTAGKSHNGRFIEFGLSLLLDVNVSIVLVNFLLVTPINTFLALTQGRFKQC